MLNYTDAHIVKKQSMFKTNTRVVIDDILLIVENDYVDLQVKIRIRCEKGK